MTKIIRICSLIFILCLLFTSASFAESRPLVTEKNAVTIYTGEVENRFVYGQGKADLITKITREYDWDLNNSYAYTDHYTDSPLLSLVSNPRAVNPDKKLIAEAKLRHWPILIWKTTK